MDKYTKIGMLDKSYYYLKDIRVGICPMMKIAMKEKVNPQHLQYAVQKTYERYLPLRFKIVETETDIHYELNEKPFIIKNQPYTTDVVLGEDSNGYPWQYCYFENYITFTFLHCIFDGAGHMPVQNTLLYYYFESMGIYAEDSRAFNTLNDDIEGLLDEELAFGLEPYIKKDLVPLPEKKLLPQDFISPEYIANIDDRTKGFSINIDTSKLLSKAKENETSVFAFLLPIIIRSIKYLFKEEYPVINSSVIVNHRPYTKSKTLRNSFFQAHMSYDSKEMDNLPLETISTIFRTILDVKLNEENIFSNLTRIYDSYTKIESIPTMSGRTAILKQSFDKVNNIAIKFSYGNRISFPKEFEDKIDSIQVINETIPNSIMALVISYKNSVSLLLYSRLNNNQFVQNIADTLNNMGVTNNCEELQDMPLICYKPLK